MTALQWIVKEAKSIKSKYPKRFSKWTEYVAQASAIYASKHKGTSPVGKKKVGAVKKTAKKKVSTTGKHIDTKSHNVNIKIVSGIGNIEKAEYTIKGIKIGFKKSIDKENNLYILQVIDLTNKKNIIPIRYNSDSDSVAYDLTQYIENYTRDSYTNSDAYKLRDKFKKLVINLKKEVVKLNKFAPTKKAIKKTATKKSPVKKTSKKRVVKATYKVEYQTGKNQTERGASSDSKRKAKAPGKRKSASGKTYYETRANRSDLDSKSMSGTSDSMFKDLYSTRERIANTKKAILKLQGFKSDVPPSQRYPYIKKIKEFKKYLIELNTHYKELKKII